MIKNRNPEFLYHGSKVLVDELVPNQACGFGGEVDCYTAIYAIKQEILAIPFTFRLINILKDSSFHITTDTETPKITLKNCEIDWEHKGYLYKVKSKTFESVDSLQWVSRVSVKPVEITVINPKDYYKWISMTSC